jgi:hypothetical protein
MGGGLSMNIQGSSITLSEAMVAVATGVKGFGFGANFSRPLSQSGWDIDLGVGVESATGVDLSVWLTSLQSFNTAGTMSLGLGYSQPRKFQIEFDWTYAILAALQSHTFRLFPVYYFGSFGVGLDLSYLTSPSSSSYTLGPSLSISVTQRVTFGGALKVNTISGVSAVVSGTIGF